MLSLNRIPYFIFVLLTIVTANNVTLFNKTESISNITAVPDNRTLPNLPIITATKGSAEKIERNSSAPDPGVLNPVIFLEGQSIPLNSNTSTKTTSIVTSSLESSREGLVPSLVPEPLDIIKNGKSSSQPRKGVSLEKPISEVNSEILDHGVDAWNKTTIAAVPVSLSVEKTSTTTTTTTEVPKVANITTPSTTTTLKPAPKKPLITIGTDEAFPGNNFLASSKEVLHSPSTTTAAVKIESQFYQTKGQPNFIIPIVITMFAVPLLALIGYQAVRRGREAWRNRHYRRMDFLIDGMYND